MYFNFKLFIVCDFNTSVIAVYLNCNFWKYTITTFIVKNSRTYKLAKKRQKIITVLLEPRDNHG